jgi:hypothetical protein
MTVGFSADLPIGGARTLHRIHEGSRFIVTSGFMRLKLWERSISVSLDA